MTAPSSIENAARHRAAADRARACLAAFATLAVAMLAAAAWSPHPALAEAG